MLESHTLSTIGFVSQAVFALTLGLLALTDRRTRGTIWLAAACALRFALTATHALGSPTAGTTVAFDSCLLILITFFTYMGVRWFTLREPLRSRSGPMATSVALLLTLLTGAWNLSLCMAMAGLTALVIVALTLPLLWRPQILGMEGAARWTSLPLAGFGVMLGARLAVTLVPPGPWTETLSLLGRGALLSSATLLSFGFVSLFVAETQRRLHDETRIDALTGLRNRRCMEETALRMVRHAAAVSRPLSLIVIDVDKFKRLNDTWGHSVGDRALQALGTVLRDSLRVGDCAARMGGEEFAVLLPDRTLAQAAVVAEALRLAVMRLTLPEGEHSATFTVSLGVSGLLGGEHGWLDMLRRADKALYRAKNEGRNRVSCWCESDGVCGTRNDSRIRNWRHSWSSSHSHAEAPRV